MATSGNFNTGGHNNAYFQFAWIRTAVSVANNNSTIYWEAKLMASAYSYWGGNAIKLGSVNINGSQGGGTWGNITLRAGESYVLKSGTTVIGHDANGDCYFDASLYAQLYFGSPLYKDYSGSGGWWIDKINRVPTNPRITWTGRTSNSVTISAAADTVTPTTYRFYINGSLSREQSGDSYTFGGLSPNSTYNFQVSAYGPGGWSELSGVTSVTTFQATTMSWTTIAVTTNSISIFWSSNVALSKLEYSLNNGSTYTTASSTSATPLIITGLAQGTIYNIRLRGTGSASGEAGISSTITAQTHSVITTQITNITEITMNSITAAFSTNIIPNALQYTINGGSTWVAASTTTSPLRITGLIPGTNYHIILRSRSSISNEWGNNSNYSLVNTYGTVSLNTFTGQIESNFNATATIPYTGTKAHMFLSTENSSASSITRLSDKKEIVPSSPSTSIVLTDAQKKTLYGLYKTTQAVKVNFTTEQVCNGITYYTFSAAQAYPILNAEPVFSSFNFENVDTKTLALTNDKRKFIQKYNSAKLTISSDSPDQRMQTKKEATALRYDGTINGTGGGTKSVAYNASPLEILWNNIDSTNISVSAVDSRQFKTSKTYTFKNYMAPDIELTDLIIIPYSSPVTSKTIPINLKRINDVGETCYLLGEGTFNYIQFGVATNSIKVATLKRRLLGSTTEFESINIMPFIEQLTGTGTTGIFRAKNNKAELTGIKWALGKKYEVQIVFEDELAASNVSYFTIDSGNIPLSLNKARSSVGIGKMPMKEDDTRRIVQKGSLDVENQIYSKGKEVLPNRMDDYGTCSFKEVEYGLKQFESSQTGAIRIDIPDAMQYTMLTFWIDVYLHSGCSYSIFMSGYLDGTVWYQPRAALVQDSHGSGIRVRVGVNSSSGYTNAIVWLGETNGTLNFAKVKIRDVVAYGNNAKKLGRSWSITAETATSGGSITDLGVVKSNVEVINNLTSTSTTSALSAAMGKTLNDKKQKAIETVTSSDMNFIIKTGMYYGEMMINAASQLTSTFMVIEYNADWVTQVQYIMGSGCHQYTRHKTRGAWSGWVHMALLSYPVGAIYQSAVNTSPASLFGGTWTPLYDRMLVGAGNGYSVNATGGATSVTSGGTAISIAQMPSHNHVANFDQVWSFGGTTSLASTSGGPYGGAGFIQHTGGGQAHIHTVATMSPYIAKYMWQRTA